MLLTPQLIKLRLKKLGIEADKYLGQHFLIEELVLKQIINEAKTFLQPKDTILEVGPGLGVLTHELAQLPHEIVAVEKDPVFARELTFFLGQPTNLTVTAGDALQVPLPATASWVAIANIPYAITSPLLRRWAYAENPPHHILVLVQKEVAERIGAEPGNSRRGLLTIQLEILYESRIVQTVPPTSFWPAPKVESALLLLAKRAEPLVAPEHIKAVLRVATLGFSAKRKQLLNALAGGLGKSNEETRTLLHKAGIDPTRRAETLSIDEWQQLAQVIA